MQVTCGVIDFRYCCPMSDLSAQVRTALDAAVAAIGGKPREGQIEMAEAVANALTDRHHLMVQAGTGTGKSLAD